MRNHDIAKLLVGCVLMFGGHLAMGQDPAPRAGVLMEAVKGAGGNEAEFTNQTDQELGIQFGGSKFFLKPGKAKKVLVPQQAQIELKIFQRDPLDGQWLLRFDGKSGPRAQDRFIPFPWAKPNQEKGRP